MFLARRLEEVELLGLARVPFAKLERGDPDEADRRAEVEFAKQRLGGFDDRPGRAGRGRQHGLPGVEAEVGGPELHPDAARGQPLVPHPVRHGVRRAVEPGPDRRLADDVRVEGVLGADAPRLPLRDHRPRVPSVRERVHVGPEARAEPAFERIEGGRRDLSDRGDPPRLQALPGAGPDPPQPIDGQRVQEAGHLARGDDGQPVGLAAVARDLRHVLGGGDPHRDGEPGRLEHRAPDRFAHRARRAGERLASRHVHERLVHAQGLDER